MLEATKKFIKEFKKLINQNDKESWEEIYYHLTNGNDIIFSPSKVSDFTLTMLQCGIDPLRYLDYIPEYYLCSIWGNVGINDKIKEFTIPNNIKEIRAYAFKENWILEKLIIPKSVNNIDRDAFTDCEALKEIHYLGTFEEWMYVSEEIYSFENIGTDIIHCTDGDFSISEGDRIL